MFVTLYSSVFLLTGPVILLSETEKKYTGK